MKEVVVLTGLIPNILLPEEQDTCVPNLPSKVLHLLCRCRPAWDYIVVTEGACSRFAENVLLKQKLRVS